MKKLAVIYARLSREDEDKIDGNKESRSIENQIKTLSDYAKDNGIEIYKVYYDDGYSGANLNRPDFQSMLQDVHSHKFNILLIKDISRLGRSLHQVGELIDKTFPENNIRVISLNDNYDSAKYNDEMSIVIRNFLNDYYLKDFRKKCRKALVHRANSQHLNYYPKYGYNYDENGKEIIDDYSANIVRLIFDMAAEGKSTVFISKILNRNHILTRSRYACEVLGLKPLNKKSAQCWNGEKVWEIVKDYEYCGHSINLVRSQNPILLKNTHLAIIDEETFAKANKGVRNKNGMGKYKDVSLSPIIRDKNTGWSLVYVERNGVAYYYSKQQSYSISVETLHNLLYRDIISVVEKYVGDEENLKTIYSHRVYRENNYSIEFLQNELNRLNGEYQRLFEDFMQNKISQENYEKEAKTLFNKIKETEENIVSYKDIQVHFDIFKIKYQKFINSLENNKLTQLDIIKEAISKVIICKGSDKQYEIEIHYKFEEL